eukprot:jgi/Psemu1/263847/estExt_Genewise1Plus.C_12170009
MDTPTEWPREVQEAYDPIRILGKGGFASVVLARDKNKDKNNYKDSKGTNKVAVKVVGCDSTSSTDYDGATVTEAARHQAIMYARREIEILQELKHTNIVRLFHHWKPKPKPRAKPNLTAAVLILEYCKGPTVDSLLKYGGALSFDFGRVVIAQTIDALAYLHYRAVLHRDIKPDNIIVSGAISSDDFIWDNPDEEDGDSLPPPPDWAALKAKYKVTLIDFGFARALTPSDVTNSVRNLIGGVSGFLDRSSHSSNDELSSSNRSVTRKIKRTMSTLGNRNFAAPEIAEAAPPPKKKKDTKPPITETISNYVADYGLLVDSYSLGQSIKNMMTGVQPGLSIEQAFRDQERRRKIRKIFSMCVRPNQKRSVRVRQLNDLPGQLYALIMSLTEVSESQRMSIRTARRLPYINEVLPRPTGSEPKECFPEGSSSEENPNAYTYSLNKISYLPFAGAGDAASETATASTSTAPAARAMIQIVEINGGDVNGNGAQPVTPSTTDEIPSDDMHDSEALVF